MTQPLTVHPWINANPYSDVEFCSKKARMYDLASKIIWVALTIIPAIALISAAILAPPTGVVSIIFATLILSTPVLASKAAVLEKKRNAMINEAVVENKILENYIKIKNWDEPTALEYCKSHQLPFSKLNPIPTPLLARYEMIRQKIETLNESIKECLHGEKVLKSEDSLESEIRFTSRNIAWQQLEHEKLPLLFDAALILQILYQPTLQLQISDLGLFYIKSFAERQFDRLYGPNDDYFVFHDKERRSITLKELEEDLSAHSIRKKLFPDEVTTIA